MRDEAENWAHMDTASTIPIFTRAFVYAGEGRLWRGGDKKTASFDHFSHKDASAYPIRGVSLDGPTPPAH